MSHVRFRQVSVSLTRGAVGSVTSASGGSLDPLTHLTRPALTPGDALERMAERVRRLSPSHRDPERFHEEKSELAAELRRLARQWKAA